MTTTAVVNEDTATLVSDDTATRRFSWSAAFAGAFVATAVTLLLLTLGYGVGLSLVTARNATENGTITFLTLGAIYFLAAQAFGFAVGGHIVARMIGPALETDRDEEIRAGTHGLVAWALAVVAIATLIALSVVAGGAATAGAMSTALASTSPTRSDGAAAPSPVTAYWVDTLFRAPSAKAALASFRRYAQANSTATDAPPPASDTATPNQTPSANSTAEPESTPPMTNSVVPLNGSATAPVAAVPATATSMPATVRSTAADKAEAGRILTVGMAKGGTLSGDDKAQLARIIANDTGMGLDSAVARVNDVVSRIHADEVQTAEMARKTAAYASLWTAFALLFGAIVAVAAAISARWKDDKEHGLLPGTRVSEVKF
ncbi:MAG: hypothetical protein ISS15_04080 [Alphaproteobacteria bacterium]|nr:hypothetical protein [Alphaproteobacteria bacterium]MBL6939299.1 hypothetical protein [Alphaproteobacteria bacterium]MBL7096815.1 hypothetical protein [Alphaproteobacteria bacterium]